MERRLAFWLSALLSQGIFVLLFPVWGQLFSYLHPIVLFVIWFSLTVFVLFLVFLTTKNRFSVSSKWIYILMVLYTIGLLVLLFVRPSNQEYQDYNLIPFKTIIYYLSGKIPFLISFYNLAANVLLFIPYGLSVMLLGHKMKKSTFKRLFIPILFITTIEIIQFLTKKGSFDIDDIWLNLLGVYIGYWIFPIFGKVLNVKK